MSPINIYWCAHGHGKAHMSKATYQSAYEATMRAWIEATLADRKPIRLVKTS
jgi:hypothetical protein